MDNSNSNQQREADLNELLERAGSFEEMVRTKGWEWLTAYYQAKVQLFTNDVLLSTKPIEEFEAARQRLIGIRDLFGQVESDLAELERYRKEKDGR